MPASKVKNHLAVSHACKATLHDFHNVLALIYAYAERNKLVHSTLETLIQSRRWTDLAATLKRDLDDVQRTIPNDQKWLQIALTWLLKGIIQDFFKHDDPNMFFPDDPTTWVPSDLLVELTSRKGSAADEDERARKFKVSDVCAFLVSLQFEGGTIYMMIYLSLPSLRSKPVLITQITTGASTQRSEKDDQEIP